MIQRLKLFVNKYLILHPSPLAKQDFILILFIIAFAIFFSILSVQQHQTFQTNGLDLGNVDQALWNTAQGHFLQFTLMTPIESRLALHVEPVLLFFVPLYWLNLGSPELLLIIQACVVALGAWPLYQIARFVFNEKSSSSTRSYLLLVFPLAYLLLPTLQSAVLFDFHAVTMAPTFILFAFWALLQKKDIQFIVFLVLAMACKEDMPLVVAMIGLYAGLAQRRWRLAGLVIGLSMVWFAVAVFIIQPQFAAGGNIQLDRYGWLGNSPLEMIQTLITQPGLVFDHLWNQANLPRYLTQLFFPTAFLALLSSLTLLPMLPTLAVNLLSDNPFTWRLEDFHYGAPLAPFLFISAIYGIKRVSEFANQRVKLQIFRSEQIILVFTLLLLIFTGIYHHSRGFTPLARPFIWPQVTNHHLQLEQVLSTIPPDSPLFTQSNLAPHLTHRQTIYSDFGYFTNPDYPASVPVEDILLDVTGFENIGGIHQFLQQELLTSGNYKIVTARAGILHVRPLTIDHRSPTIVDSSEESTSYFLLPTPFYSFAQPDPPPTYQLPVDFNDVVRLKGFTLHFNRQEEVQVTVDLEILQPLSSEFQSVLYLLDTTGQPVGTTTDLQPILVWFPSDQWQVGETVRVRFNTLPWYTRETEAYGLALGVVEGADVWNDHRHRPTITEPVEFVPRLPADGSLIELARIEHVWGIPEGGPEMRQFDVPRIPNSLEANFDNQIKLLGYSTPKIEGQNLTLELYWQAVNTPEDLVRFVQLVGPGGVYGQNDSVPDYGTYPTSLWQPGEVVVETVTFPLQPDRPAGEYTLHIGLYRSESGQRLPLVSGGDHVEISVE